MSQENVELHRRAVEAYNAHNVEALIAVADPCIEAHSVFAAVGRTEARLLDADMARLVVRCQRVWTAGDLS
jgi:hypothetical protein